jgi:hypothetical protein
LKKVVAKTRVPKLTNAKPFPKKGPIVFAFQPTKYEIVTGKRLAEWERLMEERVGIKVSVRDIGGKIKPFRMHEPTRTLSGCPSADD